MGRIIKLILGLAVLGALALVVYAYLGDMSPQRVPVSVPVTVNGE